MKPIKNTVVAFVATMTLAGSAAAADLQSLDSADLRPSVDETSSDISAQAWTGMYAGLNAGASWRGGATKLKGYSPVLPTFENIVHKNEGDPAFIGGAQAGYNFQENGIVYGVEGDIPFAGHSGGWMTSASDPLGDPDPTAQVFLRTKSNLNWFSTFRGRLGYAPSDQLMIYGTAGLALGGMNARARYGVITDASSPDVAAGFALSRSYTNFGWAAGFGAEYALADNWSLKGEYLHVDLGSKSVNVPGGAHLQYRTTADMARLGLNYHFR